MDGAGFVSFYFTAIFLVCYGERERPTSSLHIDTRNFEWGRGQVDEFNGRN